jgi:hypothetical protein
MTLCLDHECQPHFSAVRCTCGSSLLPTVISNLSFVSTEKEGEPYFVQLEFDRFDIGISETGDIALSATLLSVVAVMNSDL